MINAHNMAVSARKLAVNRQAVVFRSKAKEGGYNSFNISLTDENNIAKSLDPQMLQSRETTFRLYASDLATANAPNPKNGDMINLVVDWIVNEVQVAMFGTVFVCTCQWNPV